LVIPRPAARCAVSCLWLAAGLARAQGSDTGDWLLRARALHLDPGITDTIGLYVTVAPLRFTELDLSWFFRPDWAVEFALTVPQAHSVQSAGFEVGQLRQLPPTLLLQYHLSGWRVRPYAGAGINYVLVDNLRFTPDLAPQLQATVRNRSIALAYGAGIDVPLGRGWVFNLDVKRLQLKTRLNSVDPIFGEFKVEPLLTSVGFGLRF
jgi:outer membrane protein